MLEGRDGDLVLRLCATVDGDAITLDFTGSAGQDPGNLNCPRAVTYSACVYAVRVLTDPDGRWGPADGLRRRFTSDVLGDLVTGAGLVVEQLHGVRVVADLVPSAVLDTEPGAAAALLALERALSDQLPFRDVATQLHLLAVRL